MLREFRKRVTSAHLLGVVAIFLALGGAAYAVKANSVGSKQLKKNAVTTKKIKDAAVTTAKLADNAATGAKVDESTLGKVPSAAAADTATAAANAANSAALDGKALAQVRTTVDGSGTDTNVDLTPTNTLHPVFARTVTVPAGGADVIANASVTVESDQAAQSSASCLIQIAGGNASQSVTETMDETSGAAAIPVAAFRNDVAAGDVLVQIMCSTDDGNTTFDAASLNIVVAPAQA